ncbi:MAG: hypothetical protein H7832_07460 [Magnetococcus sp. DMHC-6]
MTSSPLVKWDCRWPDPVALQVAAERVLATLSPNHPDINPQLWVQARLTPPRDELPSAILITPWAVERIYWHLPGTLPSIQSATPLQVDEAGRVAKGQGVILRGKEKTIPVLIAWEPETGHHFVQTILHQVTHLNSNESAMAAALAQENPGIHVPRSVSSRLEQPMDRRGLFRLFRS